MAEGSPKLSSADLRDGRCRRSVGGETVLPAATDHTHSDGGRDVDDVLMTPVVAVVDCHCPRRGASREATHEARDGAPRRLAIGEVGELRPDGRPNCLGEGKAPPSPATDASVRGAPVDDLQCRALARNSKGSDAYQSDNARIWIFQPVERRVQTCSTMPPIGRAAPLACSGNLFIVGRLSSSWTDPGQPPEKGDSRCSHSLSRQTSATSPRGNHTDQYGLFGSARQSIRLISDSYRASVLRVLDGSDRYYSDWTSTEASL